MEKATTFEPSNAWFWYNRGEVLVHVNDYEQAMVMYSRALEADPQHNLSRIKLEEMRRRLEKLSD
jgi:predicted Zn-dependent protease